MIEQYKVLHEKVAAAIRDEDCCGATASNGKRVFCDDSSLIEPHRTRHCKSIATAAIAATIQGLIETGLPLEACNAGLDAVSKNCGPVRPEEFETVFREMLRVLLMKIGESA
jgi:hypothetical protein